MKTLFFTAFAAIWVFTAHAQSSKLDINSIIDKTQISILEEEDLYARIHDNGHADYLKKFLTTLRGYHRTENSFKGEISFGFNGIEARNSDQFIITTGINLKRGNYPFEFDVSANIQAQTQNGSFTETVSKVSVSYDYHFNNRNPLSSESYVFVNRSNNSLLGIDQRYEVGGGIILNSFSGRSRIGERKKLEKGDLKKVQDLQKRTITESGLKQIKKLDGIYDKIDSVFLDKKFEYLPAKRKDTASLFSEEEREFLRGRTMNYLNSLRKQFSKTRISFLVGFNYELERTSSELELFNQDFEGRSDMISVDPTGIYRVVLRPGFETRGDNFEISIKPYFKLGVLGDLNNNMNLISENGEDMESDVRTDNVTDYWIEVVSRLKFNFSKKVSLSINHNLFYDNAPHRRFINVAEAGQPEQFELFKAENLFTALTLNFSYKL